MAVSGDRELLGPGGAASLDIPAAGSKGARLAEAPAHRSEFSTSRCATGSSSSGSASCSRSSSTAIFGPMLAKHPPLAFSGPTDSPPSAEYWFGTTSYGQDVFSQFVHGLRAAFLVGVVGGGIAWVIGAAVGFTAGYRGGWIDDVLNMLTNVVLVIPTLAILIIVAAYLNVHSYATEAVLIGLTSWPWAARAVRAQTFSLKTRDFVDIARLSARSSRQIITTRDRAEHELLPADDAHHPLRRRDPDRRVARLPRPRPVGLGVARADDEQRRSSRARSCSAPGGGSSRPASGSS